MYLTTVRKRCHQEKVSGTFSSSGKGVSQEKVSSGKGVRNLFVVRKRCQSGKGVGNLFAPLSKGLGRDGVDERLILILMRPLGDRERLAVRLGLESRRPEVRHPDLDRPQTLLAQPLTVGSRLVPRGSSGKGVRNLFAPLSKGLGPRWRR